MTIFMGLEMFCVCSEAQFPMSRLTLKSGLVLSKRTIKYGDYICPLRLVRSVA